MPEEGVDLTPNEELLTTDEIMRLVSFMCQMPLLRFFDTLQCRIPHLSWCNLPAHREVIRAAGAPHVKIMLSGIMHALGDRSMCVGLEEKPSMRSHVLILKAY